MAVKGIDVSEFQTNVNWDKVKQDGIKFAIIRCGYGMDHTSQDDEEFEKNIKECERLNIPFGIYLMSYANTVEKARSEAQHILRLAKGHNPSLGLWYDVEDNATSGSVGKEALTNIINTFCGTVKNAGYKVGVYASLNWLDNKIEKQIKENFPIWVAQYNNKCQYDGKYVLWQYTSSGKVNGISGRVDMNYLYDESLLDGGEQPVEPVKPVENEEEKRIKELKTVLNKDFNCGLAVDGIIGPATTKAVMDHYLKYFIKGNFVKWTQTQLKRKSYDIGGYGIDSCYGRDTEKAIKKLQKDNNLIIDGCVGIATVKILIR
jgi:GH25 family lysozyme M1 (1,4-beta-N-acetylmuramidase)